MHGHHAIKVPPGGDQEGLLVQQAVSWAEGTKTRLKPLKMTGPKGLWADYPWKNPFLGGWLPLACAGLGT